jgi:hypothetical protein
MQQMLQPGQGGDRLAGQAGQLQPVVGVGVGRNRVIHGVIGDPVRLQAHRLGALERDGRGGQAEGDPGDGGVHTGLEGGQPYPHPEQHIHGRPAHLEPLQDQDQRQQPAGGQQRQDIDAAGVEDGDDQDGPDVVDDGQGEQERLERCRQPTADQGQHAKGEGDVGGHRDPPAPGRLPAGVDGQVQQGGHRHPAQCGDGG